MASLAHVNTKHATSPWLPSVKLDHIFWKNTIRLPKWLWIRVTTNSSWPIKNMPRIRHMMLSCSQWNPRIIANLTLPRVPWVPWDDIAARPQRVAGVARFCAAGVATTSCKNVEYTTAHVSFIGAVTSSVRSAAKLLKRTSVVEWCYLLECWIRQNMAFRLI